MENSPEEREKFARLAQQGVLRSYLLRCGGEGCTLSERLSIRKFVLLHLVRIRPALCRNIRREKCCSTC